MTCRRHLQRRLRLQSGFMREAWRQGCRGWRFKADGPSRLAAMQRRRRSRLQAPRCVCPVWGCAADMHGRELRLILFEGLISLELERAFGFTLGMGPGRPGPQGCLADAQCARPPIPMHAPAPPPAAGGPRCSRPCRGAELGGCGSEPGRQVAVGDHGPRAWLVGIATWSLGREGSAAGARAGFGRSSFLHPGAGL